VKGVQMVRPGMQVTANEVKQDGKSAALTQAVADTKPAAQ
jgi:hypothetical protein